MKKSKTILLFNCISLITFLISIIYTFYWQGKDPKSIYKEGESSVNGKIVSCEKTEKGIKLILNSKEKILLNYYDEFNCQLGIIIKAEGTFKKPNDNTIFNLFNYRKYLLSQKINYTLNVKKMKIINKKIPLTYQLKNKLIKRINRYKSKDYLNALVLGNSKSIDEKALNSYRNNGISHLFAISGMHISLFSGIILYILNLISTRKKLNYFVVVLVLIFYSFLTNFTPSVIRATILFILITIKTILKLKIETKYLLILIASFYLIYNPYMIYHIGFLFSFIITFFLLEFSHIINSSKTYFKKTIIISIIAFLSSIPILVANFFNINLISPIINLVFVPFVTIIVYPFSLVTLIIEPLDSTLYIILKIMENLSLLIEKISYFNLPLKHIGIIGVLIYYIIIYFTIKTKNCLVLILVIIFHYNINYFEKYSSVTMIDVGQGDSILIKLSKNKGNILVDTGGEVNFNNNMPYDIASNKIIPYLKSEGIKKLDYLIITHGDFDHAGMATNLIKNFKIKKILLNKKDNSLEKEIIKQAIKNSIEYERVKEKEILIGGHKIKIFNRPNSTDENDDSLVLYTKLNNQNILLMGDASKKVEKHIINTYKIQKVDILKVGHHGSKTSTSSDFVTITRPKISLISAGKNNLYGHPHKQTLENLKESKIFITKIDGSVKLTLKNRIIYTTCPLMH